MSEKALLLAKEEILRVIQINRPSFSYDEATELAERLLGTIEWDNPALMHKGIEWITEFYLNQYVAQ